MFLLGSTVDIFSDEDDTFTGLLFQDSVMKSSFASYPEVLMIDATYKLNELRMPLYLMIVLDSNGQSEIVAVFLTSVETRVAIVKMVKAFKSHNSKWIATTAIVSDKDFTERDVFKQEFPNALLIICLFHALQNFRREITCDKLGLLPGERDHALELMSLLAYSSSEEKYEDHYKQLKASGLRSVIEYYDVNWHPVRHQWVQGFKGHTLSLNTKTNNRLESINAKIKSVCSKYASLPVFFDQFLSLLSCLRNERDHSTLMALAKKSVSTFNVDSAEHQYAEALTPYALEYVHKQLSLRHKVNIEAATNDAGEFIVDSSNGKLMVTCNTCMCTFWKSMRLPCRHIFAVRDKCEIPLFDPLLPSTRWTKSYMRDAFRLKNGPSDDSSAIEVCMIHSCTCRN